MTTIGVIDAGAARPRRAHRPEPADGSWLDQADFSLRPTDARGALAGLEGVARRFRSEGDPRAAFPEIYAVITREVAERVEWGPRRFFQEPAWISRLAGRFCERYLETLRWSLAGEEQDTGAWGVAYALARRDDATPMHHAFLGLSAHINFDLAVGISKTLAEHGCATDPAKLARCRHDHDAVNELLRQSFPVALQRLASDHGCVTSATLLERARRPAEWLTMELLSSWRDRVWGEALALLHAKAASESAGVVARMERRSHRIARVLASLAPVPHLLGGLAGDAEGLLALFSGTEAGG